MIKNVIFDIGRVLLSYEPMEYLKKIMNEEKAEKVYDEVFKSKEWPMLDRGTITQDEAERIICERNPEDRKEIKQAFYHWWNLMEPIEGTVEITKKLKEIGIRIFYLSNFHELSFGEMTKKYKFFSEFDGGVVSYKEKLLKPEEKIYKTLIDRYNLNPEECIFTDDTKENIEGCQKIHMNGIVFENPKQLADDLRKYGVNI